MDDTNCVREQILLLTHKVLGTPLTPSLPSHKGAPKDMRGFRHPYIFDLLVPPVLANMYAGDDEEKEK